MAASILWAPGIFAFFLQENLHAHKIPRFMEGYLVFFGGWGGSADFIIMGAGIFLIVKQLEASCLQWGFFTYSCVSAPSYLQLELVYSQLKVHLIN